MLKKLLLNILKQLGYRLVKEYPIGNSQKTKPGKSRRSKSLTFHATSSGNYFLPTDALQDRIANTIISNQIFDKEVVEVVKEYILPGSTVLDIGANFGQMSVLFGQQVGVFGKVYSFEADEWVYQILCKNIKANTLQGVIVPTYGAVYDSKDETLYFKTHNFERYDTYGSYGINYKTQEGKEVLSLAIDGLDFEGKISFLKIDIQGGDLLAMKGAKSTIMKHRMPIIFEYEHELEQELKMRFQDYVDFVQEIEYHFDRVINGRNYLIIPNEKITII